MVDFMGAIKKPFSNMTTFIIGLIVSAIPIVSLLTFGFALKVAEDTIKGKKEMKGWALGDVPNYIVKLIIGVIIGIVYMIIPAILIGIGIGGAIMSAIASMATNPATLQQTIMDAIITGAPLIVIGAILGIIAGLMLPMAMMKWLKKGSIGAAFNVVEVAKNCLTAEYVLAIIVGGIYAIIVMAVLGLIAGALMLIPVAGWVIGALVMGAANFMISVTLYSMYAQTVK